MELVQLSASIQNGKSPNFVVFFTVTEAASANKLVHQMPTHINYHPRKFGPERSHNGHKPQPPVFGSSIKRILTAMTCLINVLYFTTDECNRPFLVPEDSLSDPSSQTTNLPQYLLRKLLEIYKMCRVWLMFC